MNRVPNPLIEQMTADLKPVRTIKFRDGVMLVALAVVVTVLGVELFDGLWRGILAGDASPFFLIGNGLLLILGIVVRLSNFINKNYPTIRNNKNDQFTSNTFFTHDAFTYDLQLIVSHIMIYLITLFILCIHQS